MSLSIKQFLDMTGKEKCTILKSIRVRLAEVNNIPFMPHPCDNIGDCNGTCSVCDAESQWLLSTMKEMEKKGYPIIYSLLDNYKFQSEIVCIESIP